MNAELNAAMHYGQHQEHDEFEWLDREGYITTTQWEDWTRHEFHDGSAVIESPAGWWGYGVHYACLKDKEVVETVGAYEEDGLSPPTAFAVVDCVGLDEEYIHGPFASAMVDRSGFRHKKFAALNGERFNLDQIDTEFVLIDDGLNVFAKKVSVSDFKFFMASTSQWEGSTAPYSIDRSRSAERQEPTDFGKRIFAIPQMAVEYFCEDRWPSHYYGNQWQFSYDFGGTNEWSLTLGPVNI